MPFERQNTFQLNAHQRSEFDEIARSQTLPAGFVLRAKYIRWAASIGACPMTCRELALTADSESLVHGISCSRI
jgi:hypothetical protein